MSRRLFSKIRDIIDNHGEVLLNGTIACVSSVINYYILYRIVSYSVKNEIKNIEKNINLPPKKDEKYER
jgi:hypothetical protein